ncbi:hypothetical protein J1C67_08580 [Clostridium gasigenes]|uniref:hypothetical protein n=1 Tax=Clostridium gasigenes TaxID=94869 RepID=UPI0014383D66|nr:hypothetical protein [Clostridium gasigenes]NKF06502.1 hypothetical protein [Clostridium gasigenes]QSW21138.1 hypothetical protein J1C67_08580 [Clostridium gasigenes]
MNNIENILISMHALFVAAITLIFFITLLSAEDELEQYHLYKALKISIVLTILLLIGYGYYMLLIGKENISVHVLFFSIETLSILTLLLNFLSSKGIVISLQIKSKKIVNTLFNISIIMNILTTLNAILKFNFFENNVGFIRYDELLLYVSVIFTGVIFSQAPALKEKFTRHEYKTSEKKLNKLSKIVYLIHGIFFLSLFIYVIYKFILR